MPDALFRKPKLHAARATTKEPPALDTTTASRSDKKARNPCQALHMLIVRGLRKQRGYDLAPRLATTISSDLSSYPHHDSPRQLGHGRYGTRPPT